MNLKKIFYISIFMLIPSLVLADQTITGTASAGNLSVTVQDDGRMNVERYDGTNWESQIFGGSSKGSHLRINGSKCRLGYFSGTSATLVSNTQSGNTITTIWSCLDNSQVKQETTYIDGNAYIGLKWTITNTSAETLSDLRFFHGEDTYLRGSDSGSGLWESASHSVGVTKQVPPSSGNWQKLTLQGITEPYGYDSQSYYQVYMNIDSGALSNTLDTNEGTDNGYALEWRTETLDSSSSWIIRAYEKFGDVSAGGLLVSPPIAAEVGAGDSVDITYVVTNNTVSSEDANFALSMDLEGWSASLISPSSLVTIPAGESREVVVRVDAPSDANLEDTCRVTLTATGTTSSNDFCSVTVNQVITIFDSYALWNTFLGQKNIAELLNNSNEAIDVTLRVLDISGQTLATETIQLAANEQRDIVVNNISGVTSDSYGTIALETDSSAFTARMSYYGDSIFAAEGDSNYPSSFSHSLPFISELEGNSYSLYNTMDPSGKGNAVPQWISVVNLDSSEKSYALERYDIEGTLLSTESFSLASFARIDVEAGHINPGLGNVGLNKLVPTDTSAPYISATIRYGTETELDGSIRYVFANSHIALTKNEVYIISMPRASESKYGTISNTLNSTNWLEIANIADQEATMTVDYISDAGESLGTDTITLPPLGQRHLFANSYLGVEKVGYVKITSDHMDSILGLSNQYFGNDTTIASYSMPLRESSDLDAVGSYNLYLNAKNWLKLINLESTDTVVTLNVYPNSQITQASASTTTITIPALGEYDLALHDLPNLSNDQYGILTVNTSNNEDVLASQLRINYNSNMSGIDWSIAYPID